MPKMGQRITDNPKDKLIQIRVDGKTVEKLDFLAKEENSNRSKIIRDGIDRAYREFQESNQRE